MALAAINVGVCSAWPPSRASSTPLWPQPGLAGKGLRWRAYTAVKLAWEVAPELTKAMKPLVRGFEALFLNGLGLQLLDDSRAYPVDIFIVNIAG